MRAIAQLSMYTLIFLIITTSNATHDERHNQNDIKHVQHITGLVITRAVPFAIPQPYHVTVEQEVPYPVKVPVSVPVDRPYEVHIPKPYTVPVIRPFPYPVHRLVPYPVPIHFKHSEEHTTPAPHIPEYHHKPLEISNHLEYDLTASLTRQVPVRVAQPTTPPAPVTPFPPPQQPTTPEPTQNPYNFNMVETMRLPLKPAGQMTAVSFQAHRPYAGFNIGAQQFTDHPQYPPYEPMQQQQQPQQQPQQTVVIRRPIGYNPDPAMIGAYQHQPNPEVDHLHGADPNDLSDEQNHDLLANFAEGALFNLNNRLRRNGSSKVVATKKSSTSPSSTTTTTAKPPKKT